MVFSDSTNKSGLVEDIDRLVKTDSSSYPIADKTASINRWYDKVTSTIFQCDNKWQFDDANATDLPISVENLIQNQLDYNISAAQFLKIQRIECLDHAGNWKQLIPINEDDLRGEALEEFQKEPSEPIYYDKLGNSIFLYPVSDRAVINGLKVYYQRNVSYFVATDTTKAPGFAEIYHRVLSVGAAYDYALENEMISKANMLLPLVTQYLDDIVTFYSSRDMDQKKTLKFRRRRLEPDDMGVQPSVVWRTNP